MESAISRSAISIWWSKIGKWQATMVVVTLATFFITLYITGSKETAVIVAAFTFVAAVVVAFAFAVTFDFVTFAVTFDFAAVAAVVAAFSAAAFTFVVAAAFSAAFTFVVVAAAFSAAAAVVVAAVADKAVEHGISKKVVWLSCAAELILILVPIVILILH